jgi:U3 small nucleolar RNA-associated protein 3
MGKGGKNRHKARTGDKSLYKRRQSQLKETESTRVANDNNDDDPTYDVIDRFHNQRDNMNRDFIKMSRNGSNGEDSDDSGEDNFHDQDVEAIMDLGVDGSDSSGDDDDSDVDDHHDLREKDDLSSNDGGTKESREAANDQSSSSSSSSSTGSSSESEDDLGLGSKYADINDDDELRNWGKNKDSYYHGDTADLEIGQEVADAYLEEDAAREVMDARYRNMTDADFVLSDDEGRKLLTIEGQQSAKATSSSSIIASSLSSSQNLSKLSRMQKLKLMNQKHPELLPIIEHFAPVMRDYLERTEIATDVLCKKSSDRPASNDIAEVRCVSR